MKFIFYDEKRIHNSDVAEFAYCYLEMKKAVHVYRIYTPKSCWAITKDLLANGNFMDQFDMMHWVML